MDVKISEFPMANLPLVGDELVPIIQNGVNKSVDIISLSTTTFTTVSSVTATNNQIIYGASKSDQTNYVTPVSALSALSWVLPTASNSRVGQINLLFSTKDITTLTVSINGGGTKVGTPLTTAIAYETYSYQCVSVEGTGTWIRLS